MDNGTVIGNLIAKITADHSALTSSFQRVQSEVNQMSRTVDKSSRTMTQAFHAFDSAGTRLVGTVKTLAATIAGPLAAAFSVRALVDFTKQVTVAAGQYEMLGIVMETAGANAGYASNQMAEFEKQLRKQGIAAKEARSTISQMAASNIDLSKSSELARAAQDVAVVGMINSSDAFMRLVHGVRAAEVEVLRTIGLNVSWEESYKRLAEEMGTTTNKLTQQEKLQARTSEVLREAAKYQGIYEKSMTSAQKQMGSLTRHIEDYHVEFGKAFQPAYLEIVKQKTTFYKELKAAVSDRKLQEAITAITLEFSKLYSILSGGEIINAVNFFVDSLAMLMDSLTAIGRAFKIVWYTGELTFQTLVLGSLELADAIINGPIRQVNSLIEAYNRIPMLPDIEKFDLTGVGDKILSDIVIYQKKVEESQKKLNEAAKGTIDILMGNGGVVEAVQNARESAQEYSNLTDSHLLREKDRNAAIARGNKILKEREEAEKKAAQERAAAARLAEKALKEISDEYNQLTMSSIEYKQTKLNEWFDEQAEIVGKLHPELKKLFKEKQNLLDVEEALAKSDPTLTDRHLQRAANDEQAAKNAKAILDDRTQAEIDAADKAKEEKIAAEKEAAEASQGIWKNALNEMQNNNANTIRDMLDGNIASWKNFGKSILDIMKNTFSQIAAAALQQRVILPVMASAFGNTPLGQAAASMIQPGQFGASMIQQGQSGGMNFPSFGGDFISGLPGMGWLSAPLPGTGTTMAVGGAAQAGGHGAMVMGAGQQAGSVTIGGMSAIGALGYGALGSLGYTMIGGALGLPQNKYSGITSGIGGAAGAYLGSGIAMGTKFGSIGGPVGAIVGAIVGGLASTLFGSSKPSKYELFGTWQPSGAGVDARRRFSEQEAEGISGPVFEAANQAAEAIEKLGGDMASVFMNLHSRMRTNARVSYEVLSAGESIARRGWKGDSYEEIPWQEITESIFEDFVRAADWGSEKINEAMDKIDFSSMDKAIADLEFVLGFEDQIAAYGSGIAELQQQMKQAAQQEVQQLIQSLKAFQAQTKRFGFDTDEAIEAQKEYVRQIVEGTREMMSPLDQQLYALEQRYKAYEEALVVAGWSAAEAAQIAKDAWTEAVNQMAAAVESDFVKWQQMTLKGMSESDMMKDIYKLSDSDMAGIAEWGASAEFEDFVAKAKDLGLSYEQLMYVVELATQATQTHGEVLVETAGQIAAKYAELSEYALQFTSQEYQEKKSAETKALADAAIQSVIDQYGLNMTPEAFADAWMVAMVEDPAGIAKALGLTVEQLREITGAIGDVYVKAEDINKSTKQVGEITRMAAQSYIPPTSEQGIQKEIEKYKLMMEHALKAVSIYQGTNNQHMINAIEQYQIKFYQERLKILEQALIGATPQSIEEQRARIESQMAEIQKKVEWYEQQIAKGKIAEEIGLIEINKLLEELGLLKIELKYLTEVSTELENEVKRYAQSLVDAADNLRDARMSLWAGESGFTQQGQFGFSRAMMNNIAQTALTGNLDESLKAMSDLPGAVQDFLKASKGVYADPLQYQRQVARASFMLQTVEGRAREKSESEKLREEVVALKKEVNTLGTAIAKHTAETADILSGWKYGGMPSAKGESVGTS